MGDSFDLDKAGTAAKPVAVNLPAVEPSVAMPSLLPPAPDSANLQLVLPAPPQRVDEEQTMASIKLERETVTKLDVLSAEFVVAMLKMDPQDPAFEDRVNDVRNMGASELQAAEQLVTRILDRPFGSLARGGAAASPVVSDSLLALRRQIDDLNPGHQGDLFSSRKVFGVFAVGDRLRTYFTRYQTTQAQINAVIGGLRSEERDLAMDNEALERDKSYFPPIMDRLRQYLYIAQKLDTVLGDRVAKAEITDPARAKALRDGMLVHVRRKSAELSGHLAALLQAYAAIDSVRRNSSELIRGLDRANSATIITLRGAIAAAQALAEQKLVLDQITGVNDAPAAARWANAGPMDMPKLQAAFDTIYATIDEIDSWRVKSQDSMTKTAQAIQSHLNAAKG